MAATRPNVDGWAQSRPARAARQNAPLPASIRNEALSSTSVSTWMAGRTRMGWSMAGTITAPALPCVYAANTAVLSTAQAQVQHNQPVQRVWLMKWAPRSCWASPSTSPAANAPSQPLHGAASRDRTAGRNSRRRRQTRPKRARLESNGPGRRRAVPRPNATGRYSPPPNPARSQGQLVWLDCLSTLMSTRASSALTTHCSRAGRESCRSTPVGHHRPAISHRPEQPRQRARPLMQHRGQHPVVAQRETLTAGEPAGPASRSRPLASQASRRASDPSVQAARLVKRPGGADSTIFMTGSVQAQCLREPEPVRSLVVGPEKTR